MPPSPPCYGYATDNCHRHSPASPEIARLPLPTKVIFDGTKLSVVRRRPKTTTYGRNRAFGLFLITQDRALSAQDSSARQSELVPLKTSLDTKIGGALALVPLHGR